MPPGPVVAIDHDDKGSGRITVSYSTLDQLDLAARIALAVAFGRGHLDAQLVAGG